jgi:6-phosphogluconolactonase (cycloisomerase 2 family)
VSGLAGSGLVLNNGSADSLVVATNGSVTFPTRVRGGTTYAVSVATQPLTPSQTCVVTNGAGTVEAGDVQGITVTCTANPFAVGGTIAGLSGRAVLQNNGSDDLSIGANGSFTFTTAVNSGAAYSVSILTQPDAPPQRCFVDSGLGTVGNGPVASVAIQCEAQYPRFTYSLNAGEGSLSIFNVDASSGQLRARGAVKTGTLPVDMTTTVDGRYKYVFNAGSSSVSAFERDASTGELIEIAGSPFATGAAAGSSGTLVLHPGRRFLYVVNGGGGNSISAFAIADSGALSLVSGSPFAAGTGPSSMTVHPSGRFAFVVAAAAKLVYVYSIAAATGALTEVVDYRIATGAGPGAFNLNSGGRFAYVPNAGDGSVSGYSVDQSTGKVTAVPGSPVATSIALQGRGLFHPSGRFLYIDGTGVSGSAVAAFSIDPQSGALTPLSGSPYVTGVAAAALSMDPAGKLMYVATRSPADTGSIAMFRIDPTTGSLIVLASSIALTPAPTSLSVDPSGKFVYAASSSSNQLYSFSVDATTGALIPLARSPIIRTGERPSLLSVESSRGRVTPSVFASKFAYVANFADNTISQYLINAQGMPAEVGPAFAASSGPRSLAADLNGTDLIGTNQTSSTTSTYAIDATTGVLATAQSPIAAPLAPIAVAIDPGRRFVYTANSQTNTISVYRFDRKTRALTATGSAIDTVESPVALTVDPTGRILFFVTNATIGRALVDLATGALTAVDAIAVESGATSIAVDPSGRFAYATVASNPGTIRAFAISGLGASLGALTPLANATSGANPKAIVVDPTGRFVYVADGGSNDVACFAINSATGALTAVGAAPSGANPIGVAADYAGRFVYAINSTANSTSVFSINGATGALTPIGTVATGNSPVGMAIAGAIR